MRWLDMDAQTASIANSSCFRNSVRKSNDAPPSIGDITTAGSRDTLDWLKTQLEIVYELKEAHRLGPSPDDHKEATLLNLVRWTPEGLVY